MEKEDLSKIIREKIEKREPLYKLRIKIFKETVKIVQNGEYSLNGKFIKIDNTGVVEKAILYDAPPKNTKNCKEETKISVIEADCLEVAELLIKAGLNPAVLNMANGSNPGGGVIKGAGAQEENLFRRTNLFLSMYQFAEYAEKYGIKKNKKQYPLNRESGGVYSPNITVFRSSEHNGYELLSKLFKITVISVPAINSPGMIYTDGKYRISDKPAKATKNKIRTILRIGLEHGHDSLVLSAFGCGAFNNPPEHMAELFKEVFEEDEFKNCFKLISFAIINRSDGRAGKNVYPFFKVFNIS